MGRKKARRRGRLQRIAAGLCATAATIIPGVGAAAPGPLPDAIEAALRTTPPARLLELASQYPDQVLANRALRRLRTDDPDAHREILLAARFARAEIPLAQLIARTDKPTVRLYACDCAARVAPLYERFGCEAAPLARAREGALAMRAQKADPTPAPPVAAADPSPFSVYEMAIAKIERDVAEFEEEVRREAAIDHGAMRALGEIAFARAEAHTSRLEDGATSDPPAPGPARRLLAVAMAAARAIDEAVIIASGGTVSRIDVMREAIAEAIYLDHLFRTGDPAGAVDAVFRELAWQRTQLHALRAGATG